MEPAAITIAVLWKNPDGLQCVLSADANGFVARVTKGDAPVMLERFTDDRTALSTACEWRRKFDGSYWRDHRLRVGW